MSRFSSLFQAYGLPQLQSQLGEPGTYTPAGGAAVPITLIVHRQPPGRSVFTHGREHELEITLDQADVPAVQEELDTVSFPRLPGLAAETFTVMLIVSAGGGKWRLRVK